MASGKTTQKRGVRVAYIDWVKAICIFLICFGNFCVDGSTAKIIICSFYLPAFAFALGLIFRNISDFGDLGNRIFTAFKRMILPYFLWFTISAIPFILTKDLSVNEAISKFLFTDGTTIWNRPLWFLPCCFITCVFAYFLIYIFKGNKAVISFFSLAAFAATIILNKLGIVIGLFGLDKCILLLGFYLLGFSSISIFNKFDNHKIITSLIGIVLFAGLAFLNAKINAGNNISIMNLDYNNVYFFVTIAIGMTYTFTMACTILPSLKIVKLISDNTLFIMCTHFILIKFGFRELSTVKALIVAVILMVIYVVVIKLMSIVFRKCKNFRQFLELFGIKLESR